jgi:hypothetical protein
VFVVLDSGYARLGWRGIRARQSFFTRPPHGFGFTETEEAPTMETSDRAATS